MKCCVIIPSYNHTHALEKLLAQAAEIMDIILVDDGSEPPLKTSQPVLQKIRFEKNRGKADALKAAFAKARELGFTHAVTMDADGQHPAKYLKDFYDAAKKNPKNIIVGARDFENSNIPRGRKFLNKFSNFWFRVETGKRVDDTQCGFRCYPLEEIEKLELSLGGFAYEVELLVKASWSGLEISQIKIPAIYSEDTLSRSHYRPFADTLKFTMMNTRLFFTSLFCDKKTLKKLSLKR